MCLFFSRAEDIVLVLHCQVMGNKDMDKIWLKNYPAQVPMEIDPEFYTSLIDLFLKSCNKFKDKPALSNFGCMLSYTQLGDLVQKFAAYLQQSLKLQRGDRIALMMPNCMQYIVAMFGALQAGLVVVNVNPLYTTHEFVHQINDSGAETLVVMNRFAGVAQEALSNTTLRNIITTDLGDLLSWPKSMVIDFTMKLRTPKLTKEFLSRCVSFKYALKQAETLHFVPVVLEKNDVAFLQYTGGTTGVPKAAMLTHGNLVANIEQVMAWIHSVFTEGKEVVIGALPLYHIFSLTVNCLLFIRLGGLIVLITNPRDIPHLVSVLDKTPFTGIIGVNTLFNALLNNHKFSKLNFSRLKAALGGGASVQQVVADRWKDITGQPLLEGYGLTEASPVVSIDPLKIERFNGSVGFPIPSTDITLRDDDGHEVELGQPGELWVKGPQVMVGYWQNPEETQKVLTDDGWLKTGDIARVDSEGFLYIVDRKKEMILVSGFNVYPNEVESVIASHPGVLEVGVTGIPDAVTGEAVKACVVRKDPGLTIEELKAYCHKELTGYKQPKVIVFVNSLPKSSVGKVLRKELQNL